MEKNIRLCAAKLGMTLWRNNAGCAVDQSGRVIRYGLANDSKQLNAIIKSSDLIGFTIINGVAVFTALEIKPLGWKKPLNDRERAQEKFIELVNRSGGLAGFITCEQDLYDLFFA